MSCEETLLMTDRKSDDCTNGAIVSKETRTTAGKDHSTYLPIVGDVWLDCGDWAVACCASLSTLRGESLNEGFLLCDFDLLARCFEKLPSVYLRLDDENILL